ncbi:hypothetical protein [Acetivibrio sp. MSJd-27]|uniref:hypothetical protein n=1 Tax=Acetivibrio sp. MSJd-27 TaxID=2841523 RepID=UPI001C10F806|nr:hypothetical protein [Acetivibrio sp. MSJd-27]MBU5450054.1 hypothetical protein [Acetivibrio sp. MSJd-27]
MKKAIAAVLILIGLAGAVLGLRGYLPELPQRIARYHNAGTIAVKLDEEALNLDGTGISFLHESGDRIEETVLNDGVFRFKRGVYGMNAFTFHLGEQEGLPDIEIEFGHFNTNWWHVMTYSVDVSLETAGQQEWKSRIRQEIHYLDGTIERREADTVINSGQNKISVFP